MLSLNNVGNMSDEEFEEALAVVTNTSTTHHSHVFISKMPSCQEVRRACCDVYAGE
jgi:hypothetical protein